MSRDRPRFPEPESDGISPKEALEVRNAPPHFGFFVAPAGERQDDVVVRHRQRVAVTEAPRARVVRANHRVQDVARLPLHPVEQRRTEVEAEEFVARDQGTVRFLRDPHVPIVFGRSRWLGVNLIGPRILTRWLVEVPVNDDESVHATTSAMLRSTFGKTPSCASRASTRCIVASSIFPPASTRTRSSAWPQCSSNR